ncbi:MAG TPA: DUF488 domain-containing protein [Thermomicrobiales bacterium]|nr:DUF488 domain-containing protein [Thermomicrobiales bacterium]
MSGDTIFTIGHSNTGVAEFIALLRRHEIIAVADVRSRPYSQYLPHFNQPALKAALREAGIGYVFLGKELGARPDDPGCYVEGKARYERIAATAPFAEGIARLRKGLRTSRIAIMCAEKDPLVCHRTILVCYHLRRLEPDLTIAHILAAGGLESHEQVEQRLLGEHGLHQASLFGPRSPEELLAEAYRRQGERIAFTREEQHNDDDRAASS